MKSFSQLKKNLSRDRSGLPALKIALLGDTATQFLAQAIKGCGPEYGLNLEIWEAEFNQIDAQVLNPMSELYSFQPEFIIIFQSSHKLLQKYNKYTKDGHEQFATSRLQEIEKLYHAIVRRTNAKIIFYNFQEIDDAVFGSFANKITSSFIFQLRKLNYELMVFASSSPNFFVGDISGIQNQLGRSAMFQPSIYINTDMVLSIDSLSPIAYKTLDIIGASNGRFKKCVILDLDNTVWGGVIGDDGIDNIQVGSLGIGKAFTEFQYWIKKLKDRGIIIAVCSKNTESVAKEPFEKHPDMVLRLDDISVFIANWENKVDNIRTIQKVLNISFDSIVFLDDNPFERNIVRENVPGLTVPELPEDPADYLEHLYSQNLFETATFAKEDSERTKQYQEQALRVEAEKSFANEDQFLESLGMTSVVEGINRFTIPRVSQLSQRSNQYNLRTVRYSEADLEKIIASDFFYTFTFTLSDKFGDNGMICTIILKKENETTLFIDTWFMSCRVLKRGMENFVLNQICSFAKSNNFPLLKGEYIATAKNEMVKDHYKNLGFVYRDGYWFLDVTNYSSRQNFIKESNNPN